MTDGHCSYKRCKREPTVVYLGKPLCEKHWQLICYQQGEKQDDDTRRRLPERATAVQKTFD